MWSPRSSIFTHIHIDIYIYIYIYYTSYVHGSKKWGFINLTLVGHHFWIRFFELRPRRSGRVCLREAEAPVCRDARKSDSNPVQMQVEEKHLMKVESKVGVSLQ